MENDKKPATEAESRNVFNLLCADWEKGEIDISPVNQYQNTSPKQGYVFVYINYTHKGTGQVIFDGVFEMSKEAETHHIVNGTMISFILTKLSDRLANNTFSLAELANMNAMIAQAKAQELQQQKTEKALPFKERMTNFLRRMTK